MPHCPITAPSLGDLRWEGNSEFPEDPLGTLSDVMLRTTCLPKSGFPTQSTNRLLHLADTTAAPPAGREGRRPTQGDCSRHVTWWGKGSDQGLAWHREGGSLGSNPSVGEDSLPHAQGRHLSLSKAAPSHPQEHFRGLRSPVGVSRTMKYRDKHRQDEVPGATYQSCLSKPQTALRGHRGDRHRQEQGRVGEGRMAGGQGFRRQPENLAGKALEIVLLRLVCLCVSCNLSSIS